LKAHKFPGNNDIDWAKCYDYYEVELRDEIFRTVAKPQNESHYELLKNRLRKYMNNDKAFGEIGFGCGLTLREASKHFGRVYGLDISPKNVELTRAELEKEGYENISLFASDILKREERHRRTFDVISFIHGLEHFSEEEYPLLFDSIRYYLKPNGIFTGALPYDASFVYRMCPSCGNVFEIDGHVSRHNLVTLEALFKKHGFEILYLDKFNIYYYRKYHSFLKVIYRYSERIVFGHWQACGLQIEFIVKPREL